MDEDGGVSKYPSNKAGAKYGTGYCDAQCPRDLKFINGEANSAQWTPSTNDQNAGLGQYGSCCSEMDIWCVTLCCSSCTGTVSKQEPGRPTPSRRP
jgi:cellulose 1,4-beta-cellobiosidase